MSDLIFTPQERRVLLRSDFSTFTHRCFRTLNPGAPFLWNWHLDLLAYKLMQVMRGEIKRLIINVPPRSLKSHLGSVALPAFVLGHDPAAQIVCVSYGQDLANKHALDCRSILLQPWYQSIFDTRLSASKSAVADFATTAHGTRLATSVGGALTGRGGHWIFIDDPIKPDEALSDAQRQACNDWFAHTLLSRLNHPDAPIIVIMQRLHTDDLVGHLLSQGGWEHVNLPAIAFEREIHHYRTILGPVTKVREAGELLHPERASRESLETLRKELGEYHFSAQYQQAPVIQGGGMVKEVWLRRYTRQTLPAQFDVTVQSWDTANKATELNDYSVCTTWGVKGKNVYLLHVLRKRMEYPELKRKVRELQAYWDAKPVLIEDKASGQQLIQDLKREGFRQAVAIKTMDDKIMRLHAQTAVIENGFVFFPTNEPWLPDFMHELMAFPKSKYDDQVDSMSQALEWISRPRNQYKASQFIL